MVDIGQRLWRRNLVAANDGNLSARLPDGTILCTPTGASKGAMTEGMLAVVTTDGDVVSTGTGRGPSSEIAMHLRAYRVDPAIGAVVHAHPPYATAFAIRGESLRGDLMTETLTELPEVPLAGFATPGTAEVPDAIAPLVPGHRACLLEFHGALTWGAALEEAYLTMERLESLAQTTATLRMIGGERRLGAERIDHVRRVLAGR
ncbi:class II aldolase/adducin family protein [Raineyella fluvialis]|uniref:Class II aldolase/adducin family protein n=1 Tax=Raineyella fluvialis TaxID=2662261 RepID=A0A5Q2FBH7_9ACTN|nr:class II aldolase/adducin family protein [Raineyella fluvialis]QGF22393.1 class II aldolase/adducin family protein [Raineyella fluvialis]